MKITKLEFQVTMQVNTAWSAVCWYRVNRRIQGPLRKAEEGGYYRTIIKFVVFTILRKTCAVRLDFRRWSRWKHTITLYDNWKAQHNTNFLADRGRLLLLIYNGNIWVAEVNQAKPVCKKLREYKVTVNPSKCGFKQDKVKFLEYEFLAKNKFRSSSQIKYWLCQKSKSSEQ